MDLGDYVPVNERLLMALDKWPELRVQETGFETIGETIVCTVTVWRSPDDTHPSVASASEPVPGRTPFTRGSERMVGFTSALGRALGYMGIGIGTGMASADEVRAAGPAPKPKKHDIVADLATVKSDGPSDAQKRLLKALGHTGTVPASKREASSLIEQLKASAPKTDEAPF
jgi:hypothetical protein